MHSRALSFIICTPIYINYFAILNYQEYNIEIDLPPVPSTLSKSKFDMSTRPAPDKLTARKEKLQYDYILQKNY